ncbi:MAG: glycosyltransferase family 2 protein [Fibrobacterota bacterium]|nr:glycosyltransferase family 2 protein [Fibrobacterota bacterium]QQS03808.1 MAG: glycosyltransferase family 2 protein [Fibrobacterota bacterium]
MSPSLAIVIPAWKPDFFREALLSIAQQTCKHFHVYIGDDASPASLGQIVEEQLSGIPHTYHRFEENLGGKDLVAHWNRCLSLTKGEDWVWLFSDDDIMDPRCVELFYQAQQTNDSDVFHFPIKVINESSEVIRTPPPKTFQRIEEYIRARLIYGHSSYVIEWVFRRSTFESRGGFQPFDLAWGSDDATWVKLGRRSAPILIQGAHVNWRSSSVNISPNTSAEIVFRKTNSRIEYLKWLKYSEYSNQPQPLSDDEYFQWFTSTVKAELIASSIKSIRHAFLRFNREISNQWASSLKLLPYYIALRAFRRLRVRYLRK